MRFLVFLAFIALTAIVAALLFVPRFNYETVLTLPTAPSSDGAFVGVGSPGDDENIICPVGIDVAGGERLLLLDADTPRVLEIDASARAVVSADPLPIPTGAGPSAMAYADQRLWVWIENPAGQGAPFPFAKGDDGRYAAAPIGIRDSESYPPQGEVGRRFADFGYSYGGDESLLVENDDPTPTAWTWRREVSSANGQPYALDFNLAGRSLTMTLTGPGGESRTVDVAAHRPILTAQVLKAADSGDAFVSVLDWDPEAPAVNVEETVYQFRTGDGALTRYDVPTAESECVAKHHVAVSDDGEVFALRVRRDAVSTLRLEPRSRLTAFVRWLDAHIVRRLPPIDLSMLNEMFGVPPAQAQTELVVAEVSADGDVGAVRRADMVDNACKYLKLAWTPTDDNLTVDRWKRTVADFPLAKDLCDTCLSRVDDGCWKWLAPGGVRDRRAGLPYNWGGADSLEDFVRKITIDKRPAGDECTASPGATVPKFGAGAGIEMPNDATGKFAAGVDCSGFVLRSWGWPGRDHAGISTSNLRTIADEVDWPSLRPGDIANRAGSHVVLVLYKVRPSPGAPADSVRIIQSTTAAGCDGVCRRKYRVDELSQPDEDTGNSLFLGKGAFSKAGKSYVWMRAKHFDPASPLSGAGALAICPL